MLFRLSSEMFPWASEYDIENSTTLFNELKQYFRRLWYIMQSTNGIRITSHPGPFNVLTITS